MQKDIVVNPLNIQSVLQNSIEYDKNVSMFGQS
jgi:hypothetical protein